MADTAEQTRVALPWQQGDARGTLDLPAATKVEDLKLCLNASDCAAVMFDAVIIEVRKGSSVLKRKLDTQEQDAVAIWPFLSSWSGSFILWFNIGFEIPRARPTLTSTLLQLVVTGTAWVVRSEVVLAVAHSTVLVLLSGIGYVPVLSREILLWRAAYLASLGACLWVMNEGREGPGISCGAFLAAKEQSTRPWLAVAWLGSRAKVACPH